MKRRQLLIAFLIGVILLAASLLLFWNHYDFSKIHPELRALNRPFQRVLSYYWFDGGSIGVEILDRDGKACEVSLPNWRTAEDSTIYKYIYIGSKYPPKSAGLLPLDLDTKRFLIEVIESSVPDVNKDSALRSLRADTPGQKDYYLRRLKEIFD